MNSQEDHHPDNRDEHQRKDKDVPPLIIIGGDSDEHTQREGGNPRRDGVELSLDGAKAEGSEDSGGEVGITNRRNDETEVH